MLSCRCLSWLGALTFHTGHPVSRYWLFTWTTYATWLPGDVRGSVASVRQGPGPRREHDQPGQPFEPPMPGLESASRRRVKGEPLVLCPEHAQALLAQWHETARLRTWNLLGVAIMPTHVHLVVQAAKDTPPEALIRDLKAYGSRALNQRWPRPASGTWWTAGGGSRRWLPNQLAVARALQYLKSQPHPLLLWFAPSL